MHPSSVRSHPWVRSPCASTLFAIVVFTSAFVTPDGLHGQASGAADALATSERPRPSLVAMEAMEPIQLDGVLDEAVWRTGSPATGFVQAEPREGQPASERTEVWVAYDDENLYVAAYLHDSRPDALVVNDIRKDFDQESQDVFSVILDTFADRRNGYVFMTNPAGARGDVQMANEGREVNQNWDAIWSVETRRVADGWTVEMEIPFRALRFDLETVDRWGVNFSRRIRRNNEIAYWAPVPRAYDLMRLSLAGYLLGLPSAAAGRDLRVKPYVLAGTVRDTESDGFDGQREFGVDVKYGLTRSLTLDITANPDFAQVEQDEQQVNLTQFSLFFPEKREFFLENSGLFFVGAGAQGRNRRFRQFLAGGQDLLVFFSRRIGLDSDGQAVPIKAGIRLTGKIAGLQVGGIAMRTDDVGGAPGNDFGVVRLRKNIRTSSDVGAIFLTRDAVGVSGDHNRVFGIDGNFRLPAEIEWNSYVVGSETPGVDDGQYAFRSSLNREGNFHHFTVGVLQIGEGFADDLGFLRRTGVRKWSLEWGLRPRLEGLRTKGIREMHPHIRWNYFEDLDGRKLAKNFHTGYSVFFNSGGFAELSIDSAFERIAEDFRIDSRIAPIPPGSYGWTNWRLMLSTDDSRTVSLFGSYTGGGLWSGTQKTFNGTLTIKPTYQFRASLGLQRTAARLDTPDADFTTSFWTMRANYSFDRNMFVDALVQYDAAQDLFNSNVRFKLIHHALSDLFIVWNEQRFFTGENIRPGRSFQVKVTQMVAF